MLHLVSQNISALILTHQWIRYFIHRKQLDVITHPCMNFAIRDMSGHFALTSIAGTTIRLPGTRCYLIVPWVCIALACMVGYQDANSKIAARWYALLLRWTCYVQGVMSQALSYTNAKQINKSFFTWGSFWSALVILPTDLMKPNKYMRQSFMEIKLQRCCSLQQHEVRTPFGPTL